MLKKIARQGDLTKYLKSKFYKRYPFRYNVKDRKYCCEILKKEYENPEELKERCPYREDNGRGGHDSSSIRQPIPMVNVIARGIASGGDKVEARL
jgi:hypothetical protein